jgi:hypothetical protein
MAFISLLDERARPKGSRDPLGFELVWTTFGRRIIGNLTTITSSLENFSVALLGFHWANEYAMDGNPDESQKITRDYFLKYEQLAAYLRYFDHGAGGSIMGINRVTQRCEDDSKKSLNLGVENVTQILSDQASYGLWGLYSSAMRETGLVKGAERKVTEKGFEIVQEIENKLNKTLFINLLSKDYVTKEELREYAKEFVLAVTNEQVSTVLLEHLLKGSGGNQLQIELWEHTKSLLHENSLPEDDKNGLLEALLKRQTISETLAIELQNIQKIEHLLVALNNVFHYCRRQHGEHITTIIKKLEKKQYDFSYLSDDVCKLDFPHNGLICIGLTSLKNGDFNRVIMTLLELNKTVMKQRNGAPWVELESGNKFNVVVKNEVAELISADKLIDKWKYDYFLGSFLKMAQNYHSSTANDNEGSNG